MKKVYVYTHDPMLTLFYSENEAKDLFGDDIDNELLEIDDDLYNQLIKAKNELYDASNKLDKLYNSFLNKKY